MEDALSENSNSKPTVPVQPRYDVLKETWRLLNSFKLAITLLSALAVVSFIGVLIPQNLTMNAYVERYGVGAMFIRLVGLNDVFHTNWFIALLAFLAFDILVCILRRITALFRSDIRSSSLWVRRLGSVIAHLSIVLILAGGMIGGMRGFRTQKTVFPGETILIPGTEAELRLKKFEIERAGDGAVKQFRSEVALIRPDGNTTDHVITVNHPLTFEGVNIFQNSYGTQNKEIESASLAITDKKGDTRIELTTAVFKKKTRVGGTNLSVLIKDFVGDFVIDVHTGQVDNRSAEHRNPAVLVELYAEGKLLSSGWSFGKMPGFHSEDKPFDILLLDYEPALYSVFEIAKSPGIQLVYGGFAGAAIGLILSMSFGHSRSKKQSSSNRKEMPT